MMENQVLTGKIFESKTVQRKSFFVSKFSKPKGLLKLLSSTSTLLKLFVIKLSCRKSKRI